MAKGKKKAAPAVSPKQTRFAGKALSNVGNMYEAMFTLDSGDPLEVRKLASKWGIKIDEAEAERYIEAFVQAQNKKIQPDDLVRLT